MIRGRRRALVAVGNSIPTIARRLLPGPAARTFSDLGSDWHDRIAPLLSSDFNSGLDREEEFAAVRIGPLRRSRSWNTRLRTGAHGSELQLTVIRYVRGDESGPLAGLSLWGARAAVGLN